MAAVEDLGEGEVVPRLRLRAGAHRDAEARSARLEAVDGDDERVLAPGGVVALDVAGPPRKTRSWIVDRVQLARADAQNATPLVDAGSSSTSKVAALAPPRLPQPDAGREEKLLPGVRPDRVAEARSSSRRSRPVARRLLHLGPPDRKLGRRGEVVVDDRAVPDGRPEHAVPAPGQSGDERLQRTWLDYARLGNAR